MEKMILIVVVYNQFKYDPLDYYSLGTMNVGAPDNSSASARYSG